MKLVDRIPRSRIFKTSLRFKVILVFIVPITLVLSIFSYVHNLREERALESQVETNTTQLGDIALGALKHAMLRNDREVIARILKNIGANASIERMWIVGPDYSIAESMAPSDVGIRLRTDQAGCIDCHKLPAAKRPRVAQLQLGGNLLRVVSPIPNDPECHVCHPPSDAHLGVLILDASLENVQTHMREDLLLNIILSLASILGVLIIGWMLIHWLVVRRIGVLYDSLSSFAAGDFSVRVPKLWRTEDELTRMADHFNEMADALERRQKEQREIAAVRQEAITQERERIARELHDGVSQMLAYLNAKLSAARLLIKRRQPKVADEQLAQMEEVIRNQASDVRTAIIGLRLVGEGGAGLVKSLVDYVEMCNRLSDLKTSLDAAPGMGDLHLAPDTELHLLRIVREAVNNARKHSMASSVAIKVSTADHKLLLQVADDGVGFDPWQVGLWRSPHFGLRTMGERAEKIGAFMKIESEPQKGTQVLISLDLENK